MPHHVWDVKFEDGKHTVDFNRNRWTGKQTILVDGVEVPQQKKVSIANATDDIPVRVGTHDCVITTTFDGLSAKYDFVPDAKPKRAITSPRWVWLFVGLCLLIPVVAIGGAIPGGLGGGGAALCYTLSKQKGKSEKTRLAQCVVVTVVCWGIFLLMFWQALRMYYLR